jgi:hypothetical protein
MTNHKIFWVWLVVIIAVLAIAVTITAWVSEQAKSVTKKTANNQPADSQQSTDGSPIKKTAADLPDVVRVYVAKITTIDLDKKELRALAKESDNPLLADTELTIASDTNTAYQQRTATQPGIKTIDFKEFKTGDLVSVSAVENIKGKTTFIASDITRIVEPTK